VGAAAWLGVRATGAVEACPLAEVARTRALRRRGQEVEIGWEKEERERMTRGVHRS
jgi:hypothetical protein